jgi:hypothetical protein
MLRQIKAPSWVSSALLLGALWGCEGGSAPAVDAGTAPAKDAGSVADAAPGVMDAGSVADAAPGAQDAGSVADAAPGAQDAGSAQDAGAAVDAGPAADAGSAADAGGAQGGGLLPDPNFMLRGPELRSPDEAKGNLLGGGAGDKKEPRLLDVNLKGQ